ncbi:hypothetical protein CC1G_15055 [Coprinopsis cinerea okayama7|uniref:Uncharacterized protein n=1 Tax=Coprinopsis cinerea (strain Okayama-7 / 130 / ATCC MYA-4618 / FGSC 9003) TaxID=240176 RepID=D6RP40_COPC7|nr:hypothetical protein CC1G_15055 [Coprinopsis cinerea okayama7\|eukprot:XP_002910721.1 hypothetical protein CC1G_15055 [Coprinopsis cinerea okayama7\
MNFIFDIPFSLDRQHTFGLGSFYRLSIGPECRALITAQMKMKKVMLQRPSTKEYDTLVYAFYSLFWALCTSMAILMMILLSSVYSSTFALFTVQMKMKCKPSRGEHPRTRLGSSHCEWYA